MTVSYFAILSALPLKNLYKLKKRILGERRSYELNAAKYYRGKSAYRCGSGVKRLVKGNILICRNIICGISGL